MGASNKRYKKEYVLQIISKQTKAIYLKVVKQARYALKHIKKQTNVICLEAVK